MEFEEFDEFRISIQPDMDHIGCWSVQVRQCPLDPLVDWTASIQPKFTRDDLAHLRNNTATPDLPRLKRLGQAVVESIMSETIAMGLHVSAWYASQRARGLRVVVSMIGDPRPASNISFHELPVEAAFHPHLDFLGNSPRTPVSRGVGSMPDRNPRPVHPPVRLLVVAPEPSDMIPTAASVERKNIERALDQLVQSGAVRIHFCDPPTLPELRNRLEQGFHIVHFIGHGDFDRAGGDPNPQPHLYFEDATSRRRRLAVDAERLYSVLSSGNVPLVVLTACSTAAASPNGSGYPVTAFESLAQTLMERQFGPSAVIAMQFDFSTDAGEIFSRALYEKLLRPNCCLDAAVASARMALADYFSIGHRVWVTPVVYWRCKEARLFEFLGGESRLSDEQRAQLMNIDAEEALIEKDLGDIARQPLEISTALKGLRRQRQTRMLQLSEERARIQGNSLCLLGGSAKPDGTVECQLTLQLRTAAKVGDIEVSIAKQPDPFLLLDVVGQNVLSDRLFHQTTEDGDTRILLRDAGSGGTWPAGPHPLAKLTVRLHNPAAKPLFHVRLADPVVLLDDEPQKLKTLDAVIFGTEPEPPASATPLPPRPGGPRESEGP
jgi:hypothetical protein